MSGFLSKAIVQLLIFDRHTCYDSTQQLQALPQRTCVDIVTTNAHVFLLEIDASSSFLYMQKLASLLPNSLSEYTIRKTQLTAHAGNAALYQIAVIESQALKDITKRLRCNRLCMHHFKTHLEVLGNWHASLPNIQASVWYFFQESMRVIVWLVLEGKVVFFRVENSDDWRGQIAHILSDYTSYHIPTWYVMGDKAFCDAMKVYAKEVPVKYCHTEVQTVSFIAFLYVCAEQVGQKKDTFCWYPLRTYAVFCIRYIGIFLSSIVLIVFLAIFSHEAFNAHDWSGNTSHVSTINTTYWTDFLELLSALSIRLPTHTMLERIRYTPRYIRLVGHFDHHAVCAQLALLPGKVLTCKNHHFALEMNKKNVKKLCAHTT